jgi:hypothetical protein
MKMISAFEGGENFGGGVITKECIKLFKVSELIYRKNNEIRIFRHMKTFFNWLSTPFLHPIFCAYRPNRVLCLKDKWILNFSQTFNIIFHNPKINFSIIIHDVLLQKRFFFHKWIIFSEKCIFNRAHTIYVISGKDARILRRFYKIPGSKIINIFDLIFSLSAFKVRLTKKNKWRIFFLGSFDRAENLEAFEWFYNNVYNYIAQDVEITVIGANKRRYAYVGIHFVGHLESLSSCVDKYDMSIAPIRSGAGIKIKVLDSLRLGIPVLGTYKAYEGFPLPNSLFVSNEASRWISTLTSSELQYEISF